MDKGVDYLFNGNPYLIKKLCNYSEYNKYFTKRTLSTLNCCFIRLQIN